MDNMTSSQETMQIPAVEKKKKIKLPNLKKLPKWAKVIIILVIIAALVLAGFKIFGKKGAEKASAYSEYTVTRGDVSVVISGSGSVAAIDSYDVTALVKGEILSSPIEEGDEVQKGDVLYTIDSKDAQNSIQKAENALEKSKDAYANACEELENAVVTSPISGVVSNVYVDKGDNIANGGKIMDIIDSSTMVLEVPFIAAEAKNIRVGSTANVSLSGSYYTLTGTVSRVAGGSTVSSEGVEIRNVEIKVSNPGAIAEGDKATATIGGVACNSEGSFKYNETKTITAKASGEVTYQPYKAGDKISAGTAVLKIDDSDIRDSVKSAQLAVSDAQLSLDTARDTLDNYTITAPISGRVIQKNSKAGDTLDNTNSQTVLCTVADMSKIVFEIDVDELDISKIAVGQSVDITADAFEDKVFEGAVDYISTIGTATNGVTSYPVRIEILNPDGLIVGMNVNAEIVVEEKLDVLYVPVGAVSRGNTVLVKSKTEGSSAPENSGKNGKPQDSAPSAEKSEAFEKTSGAAAGGNAGTAAKNTKGSVPDGFERRQVQLGINDDENIEVVSGLSEGDIVLVTATQTSSNQQMMMPGGMGGAPGGMGGGAPGGMGGGAPGGSGGGNRSGGMGSGGGR